MKMFEFKKKRDWWGHDLKRWGLEEDQVGGGLFSRCMSFSLSLYDPFN
jgi:hypothetical protein